MKKFDAFIVEAAASEYVKKPDSDAEALGYEPQSKGEKKFKDMHKVKKTEHPVATKAQFKGESFEKFVSTLEESTYEVKVPGYGGGKVEARSEKEALEKVMKNLKIAPNFRRELKGKMGMKSAKNAPTVKMISEKAEVGIEIELIGEALSVGSLKLKDGSSVKLTKEDVNALNDVMSSMSSSNKKRMEEELKKDKKSFQETLAFARSAAEE